MIRNLLGELINDNNNNDLIDAVNTGLYTNMNDWETNFIFYAKFTCNCMFGLVCTRFSTRSQYIKNV